MGNRIGLEPERTTTDRGAGTAAVAREHKRRATDLTIDAPSCRRRFRADALLVFSAGFVPVLAVALTTPREPVRCTAYEIS